MIEMESVRRAAEAIAPGFERSIAGLDYERKGVLFSEVLFIAACSSLVPVNRVLESGRARGQSTHLLALTFPQTKIVSIEFDERSPDRPFAEARLKGFSNLELRYGDSMRLLPDLVEKNDVVVIDGPKHFRALRLGLRLLRSGKPVLLFLHDVQRGCPERDFLERAFPGALFSDEAEFVERFKRLDDRCWDKDYQVAGGEWRPYGVGPEGRRSYGPTFGCLAGQQPRNWTALSLRLALAGWKAKLGSRRE